MLTLNIVNSELTEIYRCVRHFHEVWSQNASEVKFKEPLRIFDFLLASMVSILKKNWPRHGFVNSSNTFLQQEDQQRKFISNNRRWNELSIVTLYKQLPSCAIPVTNQEQGWFSETMASSRQRRRATQAQNPENQVSNHNPDLCIFDVIVNMFKISSKQITQ